MEIIKGKEKEYKDWYDKNRDGFYGEAVFRFAEKWAELMEDALSNGKTIPEVAKELSHKADDGVGITGFQYGCAVSILASAWVHGEELRRWHNLDTQCADEGEKANKSGGVLNPALLNIGVK